jgi:heat shock protein HtpX
VKTAVLLAGMTALVMGIGQLIGGTRGLLWAGAIVAVMNFVSFWFSDKLALAMNRAHPLPPGELPWLEQMVSQLAQRANLPMPRLYIVDSPTPNAFATGRSPEKAAVAVTTGLLNLLGRRELQGVIAHELSHVKNRDTLIMTVAATLAGVISHVAQWVFWFGGSMLRRDDDDEGGGFAALGVLLVAPITATLLQLAISRAREYDADASAAQLTGDPEGLASALGRLESGNRVMPLNHSPATAHLFIVNPLSGGGLMGLFATHPPIEARVQRLLEMR